jgi:hypothetical protein
VRSKADAKPNLSTPPNNIHQRAHNYFKKKEQPSTAFTRNENTGTQEKNYDLFGAEKNKTDEQLKAEIIEMKTEIQTIKNRNNNENQQGSHRGVENSVNLGVNNRACTVKNTKTTPISTAINSRQITPESALYQYVKKQVNNQQILPTARQVKTACYNYLKKQNPYDKTQLTMPKCTHLANAIIEQLLVDNTITDNPKFKRGLPKYIKA